MKYQLALFVLFALVGAFAMQGGITGNAISETCTAETCPVEEQAQTSALVPLVGAVIFILSLFFVYLEHQKLSKAKRAA